MHGPIAVIDVETTGIFPFRHDRVIEIAVVVIDDAARVVREFVTLVNPSRDIGPSSIHGLTSSDVLHAPQFSEIAGLIVDALDGAIAIAAHNVHFDLSFLGAEFSRIGFAVPEIPSLCTMRLAGGGRLTACCDHYGIALSGDAHNALVDARAAAHLLVSLLRERPDVAERLSQSTTMPWPKVPRTAKAPLTRNEAHRRENEPPTYLQLLGSRIQIKPGLAASAEGIVAYRGLLDRILEDRRIDEYEGDALIETAARLGLSGDHVRAVHREYLGELAQVAGADGLITDAERRDLQLMAQLLGCPQSDLDKMLIEATSSSGKASPRLASLGRSESSLSGQRVCFTGEMRSCIQGRLIHRELAQDLATKAGLIVVATVTKKLDILVVADSATQSGKAKKARQYGVRIIHERAFWKALGVEVN